MIGAIMLDMEDCKDHDKHLEDDEMYSEQLLRSILNLLAFLHKNTTRNRRKLAMAKLLGSSGFLQQFSGLSKSLNMLDSEIGPISFPDHNFLA